MDVSSRFLAFTLHGASWVLWTLIALSVASLAVMLERLWFLSRHRAEKSVLLADMRDLLGDKLLIDEHGAPPAACELAAALEGAKARERMRLERNLAFLATLGSNAPFIGLLGTVLGIIKAFHDLSGAQGAGPSVVMGGISEALVATAVGLMVAIPAVVAFNYFRRRVCACMTRVEWTAQLAASELESDIATLSSARGT